MLYLSGKYLPLKQVKEKQERKEVHLTAGLGNEPSVRSRYIHPAARGPVEEEQ